MAYRNRQCACSTFDGHVFSLQLLQPLTYTLLILPEIMHVSILFFVFLSSVSLFSKRVNLSSVNVKDAHCAGVGGGGEGGGLVSRDRRKCAICRLFA